MNGHTSGHQALDWSAHEQVQEGQTCHHPRMWLKAKLVVCVSIFFSLACYNQWGRITRVVGSVIIVLWLMLRRPQTQTLGTTVSWVWLLCLRNKHI